MSWSDFYDPGFTPIFVPTFSDPALEAQARKLCAGDPACLYDVAVTDRLDIGLATHLGSEELAMFEALTVPGKLTYVICIIMQLSVYIHACVYVQMKCVATCTVLYSSQHIAF